MIKGVNSSYRFVGLDLAARPERPTGWAVVDERLCLCMEPEEIFSDKEIMDKLKEVNPEWIGIDAPLTFPRGKMRLCDKELRKFGFSCSQNNSNHILHFSLLTKKLPHHWK